MIDAGFFHSAVSSVGQDLLSALVAAALTAGVATARWLLAKRFPARRMLRYSSGKNLTIIVSSSALVATGVYSRPVTGLGQLRALSLVAPHLPRAYRDFDLQRIKLSAEATGDDLENDLLVFGGPKTNAVAEKLLQALAPRLPLTVTGSVITWDGVPYDGEAKDEMVYHDYGYVVRAPNPFAAGKRVVVVAGSHTYGTVAAARWLVGDGGARKLPADVAVLVEANVLVGGHVMPPNLLQRARLAPAKALPDVKASAHEGS
jgi:hypothetical protein